jgi:2-polyprenyl-3-methyl-5-hydroxy-6-metoxy-1,4-benzoquinol methylase
MSDDKSNYYANNAALLGWGEETAKLDNERIELIKKFAKGKKTLDIGCGLGLYVDFLSSLGFDASGVDITLKFIEEAKKNKRGRFFHSRAEKLSFKDKTFDTVLLFDILEHGDQDILLKEAKRVCKERILVIVPKAVDKKLSDSGVVFRHYIDKTHLREYQEEDLRKLALKHKLKVGFIKKVHPLNNKLIFLNLFKGPIILKDFTRKVIFTIFPKEDYYTEYFMVLDR